MISASLRSSQYRKWRRKRFQIEPACTRSTFELSEPHDAGYRSRNLAQLLKQQSLRTALCLGGV
jgi:hypothetical protein